MALVPSCVPVLVKVQLAELEVALPRVQPPGDTTPVGVDGFEDVSVMVAVHDVAWLITI